MQINITARHLKLTNGLADYANKKTGRLRKYLDNILSAQIKMDVQKYLQMVEIIIHSEGNLFKATASSGDMYSAIDMAIDKLEEQLRRYKEKTKKRHAPTQRTVFAKRGRGAPKEEAVEEESGEEIEFQTEALTTAFPAQAVNRLRAQGGKFMLFINPDTDKVNLVYENNAGKFVIIEPEY